MLTYKISPVLILILLMQHICSNAQDFEPDEDGNYKYYATLSLDKVPNDFSKSHLMDLLSCDDKLPQKAVQQINKNIVRVKKAIPNAKSDFLQHILIITANVDNLDLLVDKSSNTLSLIEKIYPDVLTYESNDYGTIGAWFAGGDTYHDLIRTNEAWDIIKGDERILIGCTDSYLNETQEDLINKNSQIGHNVYQPSQKDREAHGTSVVGCLVAETNNNKGGASVSYKSKVVFSDLWGSVFLSEIEAIAQMPGVRVINLSWGRCNYSTTTKENFYAKIRDEYNVVVVAGAGNGYSTCPGGPTDEFYPAMYPSVIGVTSVGATFDRNTTYTAPDGTYWGQFLWKDCHQWQIGNDSTHQHNVKVDICAPGYNIFTTSWGYDIDENTGAIISIDNSSYQEAWGTSFAAPIVASACALVASVNPCLSAQEIQNIVLNSADASIYQLSENQSYIGQLGSGRLDVYAAVKMALDLGTVYIQNEEYNGIAETETSNTSLYAGSYVDNSSTYGPVKVKSGSDITFEATHEIYLDVGFEVESGAAFEAKIIDSPCIE